MNKLINIRNHDGVLTVSSRKVAEDFEKRHDHVLRDIEEITNKIGSPQNWAHLFIPTTYVHDQNKQEYPEYLLTRDGFTLLAMGFTGSKALEWKLKYIDAFNQMEKQLTRPLDGISPLLQQLINMELAQKQQAIAITQVESKVEHLESKIETFTQPLTSWRDDMNSIINGMCKNHGLNYQKFRGELYNELEVQAGCNLNSRVSRLRERMDKAGAKYVDRRAVTKLHVVEQDKKLKTIFEGIVRKYQLRYSA